MKVVPLRRLAAVEYGLGQPPPLADTGVPILRATNVYRGTIVAEGLIHAALEDLPLDRAPLLEAGEILLVRSGAYTGDSALVTEQWAGSAPGYDLRITPDPERADPRFLAYSLLGRTVKDQIMLMRDRAAQPHLNADEAKSLPIADLDLESQKSVADMLDSETAHIDSLHEAIGLGTDPSSGSLSSLLLERREALISWAVRGEVR